MLADTVVTAVPPNRGNPKLPKGPKTPRVVELLRKAIEWQTLLESGKIASQAEIARQEGLTRARVTQIMGMLRLAPEIQAQIQSLPDIAGRSSVTERMLRPFKTIAVQCDQLRELTHRKALTHIGPI
jgi:DNA-binding transcriptional MocR family regulator